MNKQKAAKALAILVKLYILFTIIQFGLHRFDPNSNIFYQSPWVYLLVYGPALMGMETILSNILSTDKT